TQTRSVYDANGRVSSLLLNGSMLATLGYNSNGQLDSAQFATGEVVTFSYDTTTRIPVGLSLASSAWTAQDAYRHDNRGFIAGETLGIGSQSVARTYSYWPTGSLAGATDPQTAYAYEYDSSGLLTRIQENADDRSVQRNGNTLTAGATTYQLDAL